MTYQKIGTVDVTGVVSIDLTTSPPFVTKYSGTYYNYKFVVKIKNETSYNFTGYYSIQGALSTSDTLISVSANSEVFKDIYVPTGSLPSSSGNIYALLKDEVGNEVDRSSSKYLEVRSPPTLTTNTPYTDKTSYTIGDDLKSGVTIGSKEASPSKWIVVSGSVHLYDAKGYLVKKMGDVSKNLTTNSNVDVSFGTYTLVQNSFSTGTWQLKDSLLLGWIGDIVYIKSGNIWFQKNFYPGYSTAYHSFTVNPKTTPELKIGTNHTIPSTVTKGVSSTFGVNIINTYTSSQTGYFKMQFGYPSGAGNYTYIYVVCSGTTTFNVGDHKYNISVSIPHNAEVGTYDVNVELHTGNQPSPCG